VTPVVISTPLARTCSTRLASNSTRRMTCTGRPICTVRWKLPKRTVAAGDARYGTVRRRSSAARASSMWPVSPPPHGLSRGKS
jgi:hypothetical protein